MDVVPPAHPTVTSLYLCNEVFGYPAVVHGGGICDCSSGHPDLWSGAARSYEQYKNFRVFMLDFYSFCLSFIIAMVG